MGDYNYEHYEGEAVRGIVDFRRATKSGSPAPDGEVFDFRSGGQIRLSSLWSDKHVVLEFGSLS